MNSKQRTGTRQAGIQWCSFSTILLVAFGATNACGQHPTTISGRVLDVPEAAPDNSVHFLLALGTTEPAAGSAESAPETTSLLWADKFDGPRQPRWQDVVGSTRVADGRLVAAADRNVIVLDATSERDVRVAVSGSADAVIGIVVHYRDPKNYVLAFVTPAFKLTGYHEIVDGNFGPWLAPMSTASLAGTMLRLTVEVRGRTITSLVEDAQGHTVRTRYQLNKFVGPGSLGLYYDRSTAQPQHFHDFRAELLRRRMPDSAVEVVVPQAAAAADAVWGLGHFLRVTGTESGSSSGQGRRTVTVASLADIVPLVTAGAPETLFPKQLPGPRFLRFPAAGFSQGPACGVVYRQDDVVTNGMPLGSVDTGCLDLETSGLLGYATIFNTHVPRRGPLNVPLLGLSVGGKTWVLCDPQPKTGAGQFQPSLPGRPYTVWRDGRYQQVTTELTPVPLDVKLDGVHTAERIHYWGHYPVADLEFDTTAPIQVGLRAWSPFLPGDVVSSLLPGVVFEVQLRNVSLQRQAGTVAFSFPGPLPQEAGGARFERTALDGEFRGVEVAAPLASYALGVAQAEKLRTGGELGLNGPAWARIAQDLPAADAAHPGAAVAVDFELAPGQSRAVRFVLAWHAPTWNAGGYNWAGAPHQFTHMYARHYTSARETGAFLARNHAALLQRVLAWQSVIYGDAALPVWLRESLVNVLHLITETGLWAQAQPPLPTWVRPEDGLFGMNECPRGCPQIECIPCSFYGNQPIVYFFPPLARSTLRGYLGYRSADGAPPWIFGGSTCQSPPIGFAQPARGYQYASNGISLAAMVDRYWLCYGEREPEFVREFHPLLRQTAVWTVGLRKSPGYSIGDKVIAMPRPEDTDESVKPPTEWFEAPEPGWLGMAAHIGSLHLAQLRITERLAKRAGDEAFARQCAEWIAAGSQSMNEKLWTGTYYRNFLEPETNRRSDLIFGYQLDGQWITDHHGLPSALPLDRVKTTLATIRGGNIAVTRYGAVNYVSPDGKPATVGGYGPYSYFPPEALMLAMTYMYQGEKDFGCELARRVWHNIVCTQGYTWDMPNIMRGDVDTGERTFGNDYYQDLMLWSLPAAIGGQDFGAPTKPGGLVDRVLRAARGDEPARQPSGQVGAAR